MIVVHHLETSRSTRVLWLLEELGLEYEMHRHARINGRAPENLKHIHPLGKAPFIVDGDLVLAESSAILRYIDARYGGGRLSPMAGTAEGAMHDQWLDLAEGSASFPLLLPLLGQMMGGLPDPMAQFAAARAKDLLAYIAEGVGEGPYLMGEQLTLADIQMVYTLEMAKMAGALDAYPALQSYRDRLHREPGLIKAIEAGGPLVPSSWARD
ncbi:glutathione S-transferase family protein [Parvularcula oceani]|uniref:glutathione S-transferase family protein n=1 Tax=Parvularcula oceani TaxID=1247963 RepID=UPI0004E1060A|nr:glutathione S-transferase family protein [Parvularcula oceani]